MSARVSRSTGSATQMPATLAVRIGIQALGSTVRLTHRMTACTVPVRRYYEERGC